MAEQRTNSVELMTDPPFAQMLFGSPRFAWVWLLVRLYVGWAWLTAGWGKIFSPAWVRGGQAVAGYWRNAVAIPETGKPPITYDWYRVFLNYLLENEHYTWIAPLVAWGEVLVGIALILGVLTGISAFFGALMNFSFMLAGTASTNPVLFFFSILLIQAWKIAGWYGLDRWLLPALGTPWQPGRVFREEPATR